MSGVLAALLIGVLFLAYVNGANDNYKGVATLYGSGTMTYRGALAWATLTTLAGALLALILAHNLVGTGRKGTFLILSRKQSGMSPFPKTIRNVPFSQTMLILWLSVLVSTLLI